jgi:hypothetical protein
MSQSNEEMSGFLAELANEATQKLEAKRSLQQDRQQINQSVNDALTRCFKFFNAFSNHLNTIEPEVPRVYALDGKSQFSGLKWKNSMAEFRKQSLADDALLDHVYFQVRLIAAEPVVVTRRWESFEELRKDVDAFGLRSREDLIELWRNRSQKATFQVTLEPEFVVWARFRGNYVDGAIEIECYNLDGFGLMRGRLSPELLQQAVLEGVGRFLIGRSPALPQEMVLERDFSRNLRA